MQAFFAKVNPHKDFLFSDSTGETKLQSTIKRFDKNEN